MTARHRAPLALLAVLCTAFPAPALAADSGSVRQVVRDYRDDGRIDPCKHSADDLRNALDAISADTEQYAPDFPAAIEAAIEARAGGECDKDAAQQEAAPPGGAGATPTPTPVPPATAPSEPGATPPPNPDELVPEPPAPPPPAQPAAPAAPPPGAADAAAARARLAAQRESDFATAPLVVVGALLALALLAGLLLLVMHRLGWGDERLAGARHALAEAGYRTGTVWQDFTDWVRLGR